MRLSEQDYALLVALLPTNKTDQYCGPVSCQISRNQDATHFCKEKTKDRAEILLLNMELLVIIRLRDRDWLH